jgi:nicotinate-nucleotide adenylyltransferase
MGEIALFGGSFDPPHVGHLLAAAYVLATEPIDELWFVPVFHHPFQKPLLASFEHRTDLCKAMAHLLENAHVSRAERQVGGEGRTVDLLEYLHKMMPGQHFALVLGTDLDDERKRWKSWDRVQRLARIITVARGGDHPGREPRIPAVSSTEVRDLLRAGGDVSHLVPRPVLDAIRAAGTYR